MTGSSDARRRGLVLPELIVAAVIVLLFIVLMMPVARRVRLAGWDVVDAENLHRFAAATGSYAADNTDMYWTFSWKKAAYEGEQLPTCSPDMSTKNDTDVRACVAQALTILCRRAGRQDIQYISGWRPHFYYSHLVLYDYLGQELPALWGVSPGDRWRLEWANDPAGFDKGKFLPNQPSPSNDSKRWPYSSSYQLPPAFYDRSLPPYRVSQASWDASVFFYPPEGDLGAFRQSDVAFPSQKVHLHAPYELHSTGDNTGWGTRAGFWLPWIRVPILLADGSADLRRTSDANLGWQPNHPESPEPSYIQTQNGNYPTVYRFTRGGLAGRDFGGPEVGPP